MFSPPGCGATTDCDWLDIQALLGNSWWNPFFDEGHAFHSICDGVQQVLMSPGTDRLTTTSSSSVSSSLRRVASVVVFAAVWPCRGLQIGLVCEIFIRLDDSRKLDSGLYPGRCVRSKLEHMCVRWFLHCDENKNVWIIMHHRLSISELYNFRWKHDNGGHYTFKFKGLTRTTGCFHGTLKIRSDLGQDNVN